MKVKQKEVVLLSYPFSNLQERKVRPAIIVSNDDYNFKSEDCILVPLTSVIKNEPFSILINTQNLFKGNLIRQSRIRVDKIFSMSKELIIRKIGILNDFTFEEIRNLIIRLL